LRYKIKPFLPSLKRVTHTRIQKLDSKRYVLKRLGMSKGFVLNSPNSERKMKMSSHTVGVTRSLQKKRKEAGEVAAMKALVGYPQFTKRTYVTKPVRGVAVVGRGIYFLRVDCVGARDTLHRAKAKKLQPFLNCSVSVG
jgi:hypothetical protein